ncbi:MAG: peptidase [Gemmatimonadetes bacterium]|nr:peptidase [Gemmatimonadota bacterium]
MSSTRSLARHLLFVSLVAASAARAQTAAAVKRFTQVALSPDGHRLAWIGPASKNQNVQSSGVVIADQSSGWAPTLVALPGADNESATELAWSADGRQLAVLAVLATANHSSSALFVMPAGGGPARRVMATTGGVHDIRWSSDGTRIAMLYSLGSEQANSPVAATPRDTGVMDSHIDRQHLAVVDVSTGAIKPLSPAEMYVYEYDWAPNGKQLVVSQARGSGNNNWWVARLSVIDASSAAVREIAAPKTQIADPHWSPDGSQVAYIGGLMSDQGVTGGDLFVVPAAGGTPRNITPGITSSVSSFTWTNAATLLASGYAQGRSQIATVDAHGGGLAPVWSGDENTSIGTIAGVAGASASSNGAAVAVVRESFAMPPEVWVGAPGKWTQVTHVNDGVRPAIGKGVSVKWKSEGFDVQGFLVYPTTFDPSKKYPMIVQVHGGPSSSVKPVFFDSDSYEALESRSGYFVFMPNPRGSYGQGEAFTHANVKDFGHGDLKDIMSGVDEVIKRYPVDGNRMGIRGWSYGGFMTMWAVTQTNRFKAAVTGAGISNWLSYTGENGISEWMVPFFGATAYENKAVYDKSSPINFIQNAKTPTLVVVGERDAECPAPQSFEFWRGLQHVGAATQLIVYPDEGHHFVNPDHVRDVQQRTVRWMDAYLKGPKA